MDIEAYDNVINNIEENPTFTVIKTQLYKKKNDKILKVIKDIEKEGLLYMMHDHELSAHFGIRATQEKIKEKYWWPDMLKDIEKYVKTCDRCQRRNKPQGKYELNPIQVKTPFYQIGIDFV